MIEWEEWEEWQNSQKFGGTKQSQNCHYLKDTHSHFSSSSSVQTTTMFFDISEKYCLGLENHGMPCDVPCYATVALNNDASL